MTPEEVRQRRTEELENVVAQIHYNMENPPLTGERVIVDDGSDHIVYRVVRTAMPFNMPATKRKGDFMHKDEILPSKDQIEYPAVKIEGAGKVRIVGADRLQPFTGDEREVVEGK